MERPRRVAVSARLTCCLRSRYRDDGPPRVRARRGTPRMPRRCTRSLSRTLAGRPRAPALCAAVPSSQASGPALSGRASGLGKCTYRPASRRRPCAPSLTTTRMLQRWGARVGPCDQGEGSLSGPGTRAPGSLRTGCVGVGRLGRSRRRGAWAPFPSAGRTPTCEAGQGRQGQAHRSVPREHEAVGRAGS